MARRRLITKTPLGKRLDGAANTNRRNGLYEYIAKRNGGIVPCYVCKRPVSVETASLEHVIRKRDGGSDSTENLAISHEWCNRNRDLIEEIGFDAARRQIYTQGKGGRSVLN